MLYSDFKDAVKSTWNEKSRGASDTMTFSLNKINVAYSHILKELKEPLYNEDDVILNLLPFLNGSLDIRAFSIRLRCKIQAKFLLDKEVIEIYSKDTEADKQNGIALIMAGKSSKPGSNAKNILNRSNLKEGATKSAINLPKSIIPIPKDFKDVTSSEMLQEELSKQYQTTSSHLKDLFTTTL